MPVRFGLSWRSSWPDQASRDDQAWLDQAAKTHEHTCTWSKLIMQLLRRFFLILLLSSREKLWGIDCVEKLDNCACRARRRDRLMHNSVGAVTAAVTAVEPFKFHRIILPVLS
jgi:hypothetical protein